MERQSEFGLHADPTSLLPDDSILDKSRMPRLREWRIVPRKCYSGMWSMQRRDSAASRRRESKRSLPFLLLATRPVSDHAKSQLHYSDRPSSPNCPCKFESAARVSRRRSPMTVPSTLATMARKSSPWAASAALRTSRMLHRSPIGGAASSQAKAAFGGLSH